MASFFKVGKKVFNIEQIISMEYDRAVYYGKDLKQPNVVITTTERTADGDHTDHLFFEEQAIRIKDYFAGFTDYVSGGAEVAQ